MAIPIIDGILSIGEKLIDKLIPDPKQKADALLKLKELEQNGDLQAIAGQVEINKIEAASSNVFIAGWRPFVGWVCGAGLGMAYVLGPLVQWIAAITAWLHGLPWTPPVVDMTTLSPILMAMLGMAGLRTFEKFKNVEGNR